MLTYVGTGYSGNSILYSDGDNGVCQESTGKGQFGLGLGFPLVLKLLKTVSFMSEPYP